LVDFSPEFFSLHAHNRAKMGKSANRKIL